MQLETAGDISVSSWDQLHLRKPSNQISDQCEPQENRFVTISFKKLLSVAVLIDIRCIMESSVKTHNVLFSVNIPTAEWILSSALGIRKLIANIFTRWREALKGLSQDGGRMNCYKSRRCFSFNESLRIIPFSARSISLDLLITGSSVFRLWNQLWTWIRWWHGQPTSHRIMSCTVALVS